MKLNWLIMFKTVKIMKVQKRQKKCPRSVWRHDIWKPLHVILTWILWLHIILLGHLAKLGWNLEISGTLLGLLKTMQYLEILTEKQYQQVFCHQQGFIEENERVAAQCIQTWQPRARSGLHAEKEGCLQKEKEDKEEEVRTQRFIINIEFFLQGPCNYLEFKNFHKPQLLPQTLHSDCVCFKSQFVFIRDFSRRTHETQYTTVLS